MNHFNRIQTNKMPNQQPAYAAIGILCLLLASFSAMAGFDEAEAAYRKGDRETAFIEYRTAALEGDIRAFGKLGGMYIYGLGTKKDYTMAYVWFGLAYETGDEAGGRFQGAAASTMSMEQIQRSNELLNEQRKKLGLKPPTGR